MKTVEWAIRKLIKYAESKGYKLLLGQLIQFESTGYYCMLVMRSKRKFFAVFFDHLIILPGGNVAIGILFIVNNRKTLTIPTIAQDMDTFYEFLCQKTGLKEK